MHAKMKTSEIAVTKENPKNQHFTSYSFLVCFYTTAIQIVIWNSFLFFGICKRNDCNQLCFSLDAINCLGQTMEIYMKKERDVALLSVSTRQK